MIQNFLNYNSSKVEYIKFGEGKKLLVAFHGFGDSASLFKVLQPALSLKYTVYALSFPYHGKTQWNTDLFSKEDILEIIKLILEKENKTNVTLMGYSMGGKVVLNMIPILSEILDKVYLLAPDGIKTHILYDIHNLPNWFIDSVKWLMKKPRLFFKVAKFFHKNGLLSKFLYDFTKNHFSTYEQRQRFFNVSQSLQDSFGPNIKKVKSILNDKNIEVEMYFGVRDQVIPPEAGTIFSRDLKNCHYQTLNKGHLIIDRELNEILTKRIEKEKSINNL